MSLTFLGTLGLAFMVLVAARWRAAAIRLRILNRKDPF